MPGQTDGVVQHLRRAVLLQGAGGLTDGQLLECFVSGREPAALEALVRRHGPMVWGVCRRVLGDHHDAEDAFQATFLVLVRRAASVTPREMVGNWLYGVARQTAMKARATAAMRRARERQMADVPEPTATEPDSRHDLQPVLDQELSRLPDIYRAAIVLCDLEGKTRTEAARQLGCPEGTIAARLARGRAMLAKRLNRHGQGVPGVALTAALSQQPACVPASAVSSTIKAVGLSAAGQAAAGAISTEVAHLTEGVLRAMSQTKLNVATAVLLVASVIGLGTTLLAYGAFTEGQQAAKNADREKAAKDQKEVPDKPHDFGNLKRLAAALEDFNHPEKASTSITVWRQSGGKGTSTTTDARTLDLTKAMSSHGEWDGFDLENVAIVRADGRTIQFVNAKDKVTSGKPFGLSLKRGDLVVVLKAPEK
jgi:RNA polymerase sigma factor (sigma-70 family)